jgi:PAS domain S-box-containing protein
MVLVGASTAVLGFLLRRQKQDDSHDISLGKAFSDRLDKSEQEHRECRIELAKIKEERLKDREAIAKLESAVAHLQGDMQVNVARGMIVCDENGIMLEANHGVTLILGYAESELIGQPVHKLIPYDLRPQHETKFAEAVQRGNANTRRDAFGLTKHGIEVPITIELASLLEGGKVRFTAKFWRKVA